MTHHQRQGHPNVSVKELLVGGSRRRIVMNAGAFYVRAITLRWRVVECQQNTFARRHLLEHMGQKQHADPFDLAAETAEKVIMVLVIVLHPGPTQPTGDGSLSPSEQHAGEQGQQPYVQPRMQRAGHGRDADHNFRR
jgi:hypothetical protein